MKKIAGFTMTFGQAAPPVLMAADPLSRHAVVAMRWGSWSLHSHHESSAAAVRELHRVIDTDPLRVVAADVWLARNGNVQLWRTRAQGVAA